MGTLVMTARLPPQLEVKRTNWMPAPRVSVRGEGQPGSDLFGLITAPYPTDSDRMTDKKGF